MNMLESFIKGRARKEESLGYLRSPGGFFIKVAKSKSRISNFSFQKYLE